MRVRADLGDVKRNYDMQKGIVSSTDRQNMSGPQIASQTATNYQNHRSLNVVGASASQTPFGDKSAGESITGLIGSANGTGKM